MEETKRVGFTRRALLTAAVAGGAGFAGPTLVSPDANDSDDAVELIKRLTGKIPTESGRLHIAMPRVFPNGYTVPLSLEVDTPMTETDHVRYARGLAPRNPLIEVAFAHKVGLMASALGSPPQRRFPRTATQEPNRALPRDFAFAASSCRFFGGALVSSELSRRAAIPEISSTAPRKASSLLLDGLLNPLIFLTNWSEAARISSPVTGGSKLKRGLILRHIP